LISRPEKNKPFWEMKEKLKSEIKFTEIYLNPLTREETFELSKQLLKIPRLPEELVERIVNDAGGNPFFLEELIKLLISKGIIYRSGTEWYANKTDIQFEIPYSIEGIIQASYDTLSSELRDLLSEMAVLGRTFNKKVLLGFTRHWDKIDELLNRLLELGYISTNNFQDFAFNHALVRESIYKSIPQKRLKELHLSIARTIESLFAERLVEFYDILFEHYAQAGEKEKAIYYAEKAGVKAEKQYANMEAITYYLYILKELKPENEEARQILFNTIYRLGKIYSIIGNSDDAIGIFQQGLKLASNVRENVKILNAIADAYQRISDYGKALEFYNEGLKLLIDSPEEEKLDTWLGIAWIYYLKGEMKGARELLEQILKNIKETSSIEARKKLARVYNQLGSIYSRTGEYEKSFEAYKRALKIYEMLDDMAGMAVIYNNISGYYARQGDFYKALEYLNNSLQIDIKTGNLLAQAIATYNIGDIYYQLGDLEQAIERFNEYLTINAQINNQLGNGYGNYGLGRVYLEKEDLKKAEEHLNRAYEIFQKLGSVYLATNVMATIAELETEKENFLQAIALFDELEKKFDDLCDIEGKLTCIIGKADVKIKQALKEKKLMVSHLYSALEYLNNVQAILKDDIDLEIKFTVDFYLAQVNYYLTKIDDAKRFFNAAKELLKKIISKIPEGEPQKKFLGKRIYRKFQELENQLSGS
ncbi:MAG: tetratricopeptide repeat protein, partial [candidate division WOR-3 bacterium]